MAENRKRRLEEEDEQQRVQNQVLIDHLRNIEHEQDELDAMLASMFIEYELDDSDEEIESKWGSSLPGKAANKKRDFKGAYENVKRQYFNGDASIYDDKDFERRFRMPREVFTRIHDKLLGKDPFMQKVDALGKEGIYPLVRMIAAIRMLSYGDSADRQDEYLQISETAAAESMKAFCKLMVQEFGPEYLNLKNSKTCPQILAGVHFEFFI